MAQEGEQDGAPRRDLLAPSFPGDTGEADAPLTAALTALARRQATSTDVLEALTTSRLIVPVIAVLGEMELDEHGRAHDKSADMATVLLTGADGRKALLAFTGLETLKAWQADARPVPVAAADAAKAAIQDHADAIVIDVAGPVPFAVEGDDLMALGSGWRLARVGEQSAWIRPAAH
jgi:hypothetical protein